MSVLRQIQAVWLQYREFQAAVARFRRLPHRLQSELAGEHGGIAAAAFAEAERRAAAFASRTRSPRNRTADDLDKALVSDFRS